MLNAVAQYLQSQGYENVFIDYQPEVSNQAEMIALFCWDKIPAPIQDGTANHMVQLRVRRYDHSQAMEECRDIALLLDSGDNEEPIPLAHPGVVIGRVRRMPIVLEREEDTVTVYAELALWGFESSVNP